MSTKTGPHSSPVQVLANGLSRSLGFYGETRLSFLYPDARLAADVDRDCDADDCEPGDPCVDCEAAAETEPDEENSGEIVHFDVCLEGAPSFLGEYPQAESVAKLLEAVPEMVELLRNACWQQTGKLDAAAVDFASRAGAVLAVADGTDGDSKPAQPDTVRADLVANLANLLGCIRQGWTVATDHGAYLEAKAALDAAQARTK